MVYDMAGSEVAAGVVGGGPIVLEPGFYRVTAATDPPQVFDRVEIPGESEVSLSLN
ncbi:MAG: hypothetical protein ACE5EG_04015 [Thermoanaerobaculia bacterium]